MCENGGQDTAPIAFCSPLVGSRCLSLKTKSNKSNKSELATQ